MTQSFKPLTRVSAVALALAVGQAARGSLVIDFQFDNAGNTLKSIGLHDAGTTLNVQVWGTVSIGPSDNGIVGISLAAFRAQSQKVNGGAFVDQGAGTFTATPGVFDNNSIKGQTLDINADGIRDLGVTSAARSINDAAARAIVDPDFGIAPAYYSDEGPGWIITNSSAKIQLGTFKVVIGTLGSGTTKFNVALPVNVSAAGWFENVQSEDGTTLSNPVNNSYTPGTSVTFVGPPSLLPLRYALTTHNDATLGTLNSKTLAVAGNNGRYADPGPAANYAPANGTTADYAIANGNLGVGSQVPVLVLVDFNLGSSAWTMAQIEAGLTSSGDVAATSIVGPNDVDSGGQRALLLSQYPSFAADAAHVVLLEFLSAPGAVANGLHFGFDLTSTDVSVSQVVVVPEPASVGLLALSAFSLMRRRGSHVKANKSLSFERRAKQG